MCTAFLVLQLQEAHQALFCRRLRKDAVPTVAYSDSFGEAGSSGTLGYYLASAFDQIYVHDTGMVSFTGEPPPSCPPV